MVFHLYQCLLIERLVWRHIARYIGSTCGMHGADALTRALAIATARRGCIFLSFHERNRNPSGSIAGASSTRQPQRTPMIETSSGSRPAIADRSTYAIARLLPTL